MLEEFLGREKVIPLFAKDWVDVMIDVDRDTGGKELMAKLQRDRSGGLPWLVILDGDGKEVISSNAPPDGSNIGAPVSEAETAHFRTMLQKSRSKLTDEDFALLMAEQEAHGAKHRRR